MNDRIYSAVVDTKQVFLAQAHRLVWSLMNKAGVPAEQIILYAISPATGMRELERAGIRIVEIDPFPGNPWCNKLQRLKLLESENFSDTVMLDTDTLVLEPPPTALDGAMGKPVDYDNPTVDVLMRIYDKNGLPWSDALSDINGMPTVRANINGGVVVVSKECLSAISDRWLHWAHWLMENERWLGMLVDQVSFSMAVAETGARFEELDRRYNFPTQVPQTADLDRNPAILHYHRWTDGYGYLKDATGLTQVGSKIMEVNKDIEEYERERQTRSHKWFLL